MGTLYIVRHGNTFDVGDIVTRVGAKTDLPLSASGEIQAQNLAAHFHQNNIVFEKVLSSPLKRTFETAKLIAGANAPIHYAEFLKEIDYGPDENKPEAEVIARIGESALAGWDRASVPPPGWLVDPAAIEQSWRDLFAEIAGIGGNILAVTSNGIARFALNAAQASEKTFPKKLRTGAYGRVTCSADNRSTIDMWDVRPSTQSSRD